MTAYGDGQRQQAKDRDDEWHNESDEKRHAEKRPQQDHRDTDARTDHDPYEAQDEGHPTLAVNRRVAILVASLFEPDLPPVPVESRWLAIRHRVWVARRAEPVHRATPDPAPAIGGLLMAIRMLGILAIAVAIALIALMLHEGEPGAAWWWLLALPFGVWIIGPAIAPYILAHRAKKPWFARAMLAFPCLSSAWSVTAYYQAFFVSASSSAVLVMIFVPLYQWAALLFTGLVSAGIVRWRGRSR